MQAMRYATDSPSQQEEGKVGRRQSTCLAVSCGRPTEWPASYRQLCVECFDVRL